MKKLLFIALTILLAGCATSGKNEYMNMEDKYTANNKNINFENSVSIETEKLEKISLVKEDSLYKFNEYISYYKVLKLKAEANKKYKIDLWSVCDCFAPKKIINPIFETYNSQGLPVKNKIIESKAEDVNWEIKRPFSIHNVYEFESTQDQYIFIVLAANNGNIGKQLTRIEANAYAPGIEIPMSISVISHPLGSFELMVSHKNN